MLGDNPAYLRYLENTLAIAQNPNIQANNSQTFLVVDEKAAAMLKSYKVGDEPQSHAYEFLDKKGITIIHIDEVFEKLKAATIKFYQSRGMSPESAEVSAKSLVDSVFRTYNRMNTEEFEGKKIFSNALIADYLKGIIGFCGLGEFNKNNIAAYFDIDIEPDLSDPKLFKNLNARFAKPYVDMAFISVISLRDKIFGKYKKAVERESSQSEHPFFETLKEDYSREKYVTCHYSFNENTENFLREIRQQDLALTYKESDVAFFRTTNPYSFEGVVNFMRVFDNIIKKFKKNRDHVEVAESSYGSIIGNPFSKMWEERAKYVGYGHTTEEFRSDPCTIFAEDFVESRGLLYSWLGERGEAFFRDIRVPNCNFIGANAQEMLILFFSKIYEGHSQLAITAVEKVNEMINSESPPGEEASSSYWPSAAVAVATTAAALAVGRVVYNKYAKKNDNDPKTGAGR
ncbi:MAG: hypothetical protein V4612_07930 [Pseudomonadota bacterium]